MARFLFYDDKVINLMLVDEKPCGGSAVQTYGWIKGLLDEGQEVYVITDINNKKVLKDVDAFRTRIYLISCCWWKKPIL